MPLLIGDQPERPEEVNARDGVSIKDKVELSNLSGQAEDGVRYLQHSPYTELEHLLDLATLDKENALLARALACMENVRGDYATAPYLESFNWAEVMNRLQDLVRQNGGDFKATSWYIVAFRSQIPPTTVYADLGILDKAAHAEANASGGFLK